MAERDVCQLVLGRIKNEGIRPIPKWVFLIKKSAIWTMFLLSLIVGGFAVSVIIYSIQNNDWAIYRKFNNNPAEFALMTLPYFWILLMTGFMLVAYHNFKCTTLGYRVKVAIALTGSLSFSAILGIVFYQLGFGKTIETIFDYRFAAQSRLFHNQEWAWSWPEKGLLEGVIVRRVDGESAVIKDFFGKEWLVDTSGAGDFNFDAGKRIKMTGRLTGNNTFAAENAWLWH